MAAANSSHNGSVELGVQYYHNYEDNMLTDTIAAIVSAVMAMVFVVLIVCIIQVIKKHRQEQQGNRLGQPIVHTITSAMFGAHVAAYRNMLHSSRGRQEDDQTANSNQQSQAENASVTPSTSDYTLSTSSSASLSPLGEVHVFQNSLTPPTLPPVANRNIR